MFTLVDVTVNKVLFKPSIPIIDMYVCIHSDYPMCVCLCVFVCVCMCVCVCVCVQVLACVRTGAHSSTGLT